MPHLWQFSKVVLDDKMLISGTVLEGKAMPYQKPKSIIQQAWNILSSYFKRAHLEKPLCIIIGKNEINTTTDNQGFFSVILDYSEQPIQIQTPEAELALPQHYPTHFPKDQIPVEVISDVDDTLIVSNTASSFKRISNILFKLPQKRRPVPFTNQLLNVCRDFGCRISYLSKSESNLYRMLAAIIKKHNLPEGPLLLTPYLRFLQMIRRKKDKDYKYKHLKTYFEQLSDRYFILFGDDSQQDMDVYAKIAEEYPSQVYKIYIRQTTSSRTALQQQKWERLVATQATICYFNDRDSVEKELEQLYSFFKQQL